MFVATGRSEDELAAFRRISNDEGRIHDFDDYQRVRAGGRLRRDAREWDEESKTLKRERRTRMREGLIGEDLRPTTGERPGISQHEADIAVRDIIAGHPMQDGDLSRIQARAAAADFPQPKSLTRHLRKRVNRDEEWAQGVSESEYLGDLKRGIKSPNSRVAVYNRYGGSMVAFVARTEEVIPESRLGRKHKPHLVTFYSANDASIVTGYMVESLEGFDFGENTRWLR